MYWWQGSQAAGLAWKQFVFGMKNILTSKIASQGFPKPECVCHPPFLASSFLVSCYQFIFPFISCY